ncbi:MAG TPA: basic secretory protein-like protein [Tepidisphaeraceae bacterium]|nr:basic secretory protein-like protein [Tepidisphaeraceae bacterium]
MTLTRRLLLLALALLPTLARADAPPTKATISFDISDAPEMKDFADRARKVADEWYPKIIALLPSDKFAAPDKVFVTFRKDYKGVAQASGNRILCSPKWFTDHPDDVGAVVHELVHVVQSYGRGKRPGWLVEGIADYVRFFHYEPESARPKPNPARSKYTDSYRTTGHFLDWAQRKYDKDLVVKLNAACRQARYTDDLWKEITGKTMDELGDEWKASLAKR